MEIKKTSKQQTKVQVNASLSPTIQASRQVASSLAKETAVFNNLSGLTVKSLNRSLVQKGEQDALLDAAKDSATQDEYLEAKNNLDAYTIKKAELEAKGTAGEDEYGDPSYGFEKEEDKKAYADLLTSGAQAKFNASKRALEDNKLNMKDTTFTAYGKGYQQKARMIGLNKLMISLDVTSQELAVDHAKDPIAYNTSMNQYRKQMKEGLPPELHAAYNQKALVAQNTYSKAINKNVTKIHNEELAATTIQKLDLTRTNLLNAASSEDKAGFISAKQDYKTQLQVLVKNGLIKQAQADEKYRVADAEATQQMIMTDFDTILQSDPVAAQAYLEYFASKTSSQAFGLSAEALAGNKNVPKSNTPNPLDIEYDTLERDTMAAQMQKSMNNYNKAVSAENSKNKTDNNKFAQDERALILSGKMPSDPMTGMVRGVNISTYEYDKLKMARDNMPKIATYHGMPTIDMKQQYIQSLKSQPEYKAGDTELVEALEAQLDQYKADVKNDPGMVSNDLYNQTESFGPQFDINNLAPYLEAKESFTRQLNFETNAPLNLLSNTQADQLMAAWNNYGREDKLSMIMSLGNTPQAQMLFDQLGAGGSEMEVLHNVMTGKDVGSRANAITILNGQERLQTKETSYNKDKIYDVIRSQLNGRMEHMDGGSRTAYYDSIAAHALGNNPSKTLIDIDDSETRKMIEESLNTVFGKNDNSWFGNNSMTIYNKTSDQVKDYIGETNANQVTKTIPADSTFYSADPKNPLTAKTLADEISYGKIRLIATGVSGEYILKRGTQVIHTTKPTGRVAKDGYVYTQQTPYKFKLWSNK